MTETDVQAEARPYALPEDADLPYGRGELTQLMPPSRVRSELGGWQPYPTVAERERWDALPDAVRTEIGQSADQALNADWPQLRASVFADYQRNGNRSRFEAPHFERRKLLRDLVLGACLTDDQQFTDPIMDAVWSICEESFWGVAAHSFSRRYDRLPLPAADEPVVDLFAAETGAQLAWTRYLLGDRLIEAGGQALDDRIVAEIDRRLLTPFLERDDWFWLAQQRTSTNNWTPWICSNLLVATLLTEDDHDRQAVIVSKVIAALDVYIHQLSADGGCSEGQSYWAAGPARLIDALDVLSSASDGALNGFTLPKVAAISRYPVALHVDGRTLIQHADGHGQWLVETSVLHRAGRLLDDAEARQLAVHMRDVQISRPERSQTSLWRFLGEIFEPGFIEAPATPAPLIEQRWFPDLELLVAREQGGEQNGFLLCMKGGNNAEHHNHNDVGGVSVGIDGQLLVIDPGVGTYTKQTFSPQRYDLWEVNSDWHGLPIINDLVQSVGDRYAAAEVAVDDGDTSVGMTAELAGAWPEEAGVRSYRRTATLDRAAHQVVLTDQWQVDDARSVVLPLTVAVEPVIDGDRVHFSVGDSAITLEIEGAARVAAQIQDLDDPQMRAPWGDRIWRVLITPDDPSGGRLRLVFRRSTD